MWMSKRYWPASLGSWMPEKVDSEAIHLHRMTERKDEFRADWERNLAVLLPTGAEEEFDDVWKALVEYVGRIATAVP